MAAAQIRTELFRRCLGYINAVNMGSFTKEIQAKFPRFCDLLNKHPSARKAVMLVCFICLIPAEKEELLS